VEERGREDKRGHKGRWIEQVKERRREARTKGGIKEGGEWKRREARMKGA